MCARVKDDPFVSNCNMISGYGRVIKPNLFRDVMDNRLKSRDKVSVPIA